MKWKAIPWGLIAILSFILVYQYINNKDKENKRWTEYLMVQRELQSTKDSLLLISTRYDSLNKINKVEYEESKDKIDKVVYVPYNSIAPNDRRDSIRAIINEGRRR